MSGAARKKKLVSEEMTLTDQNIIDIRKLLNDRGRSRRPDNRGEDAMDELIHKEASKIIQLKLKKNR